MTWIDLVRYIAALHNRSVTDSDADHILWEHTAFPLDDIPGVAGHLAEHFRSATTACCARRAAYRT